MINYNEHELREAAKSDKWKQLLKEESKLFQFIDELRKERVEFERQQHKKKLQGLKQGAQLWTCRSYTDIPYGSECRKVSNGSKNMQVVIKGVRWNIPYGDLTDVMPDKSSINTNRRIANVFTRIK